MECFLSSDGLVRKSNYLSAVEFSRRNTIRKLRLGLQVSPYRRRASTPATVPSYMDSGVQPEQTYYYVVTALDSTNGESAYSSEVAAIIPSTISREGFGAARLQCEPRTGTAGHKPRKKPPAEGGASIDSVFNHISIHDPTWIRVSNSACSNLTAGVE